MGFFHQSPSGLCVLSGYLELPMVSVPCCGVGGGLVAVFLPASCFDASPLQVDFIAGTLASASSSMSGSLSGLETLSFASNSSISNSGDMSTLTAGAVPILALGKSSKYV